MAHLPLLTDRFYRSVVVGFGAEWVCIAAPSYHVGSLPFRVASEVFTAIQDIRGVSDLGQRNIGKQVQYLYSSSFP